MSRFPPSDSHSEEERRVILQELYAVRDLKLRAKAGLPALWRKLLGSHFEEAAISPLATLRFVTNPDPMVRRGAFGLLRDHWPADRGLVELYKQTITSDPDVEVRCIVVWSLVNLYRGTADRDISVHLARIAKDVSQFERLRRIAYWAVLDVQGIRIPLEAICQINECGDHLPEGLDWGVVDSLLSGDGHLGRG